MGFDSRQNQQTFCILKIAPTVPEGPPRFPVDMYRVLFLEVKRPARDAPPCSADAKNEWSYTSVAPTMPSKRVQGSFTYITSPEILK